MDEQCSLENEGAPRRTRSKISAGKSTPTGDTQKLLVMHSEHSSSATKETTPKGKQPLKVAEFFSFVQKDSTSPISFSNGANR